jgi:cytochrome c-type biogenesis protein
MPLILLSFFAGVLTVLAPCVLPLLPVIIGSSSLSKNKFKPYFVTLGLILSITLFTLLLKASTLLINIDPIFWKIISGGILVIFGLIYLFPNIWDKISFKLNLSNNSDKLLHQANKKEGFIGDTLVGASLGPVFSSCSPTYSLIIATVLPVNFVEGLLYILVYSFGLGVSLLAIALLGRKLTNKLKVFANPDGKFKKVLGIIFVLVGIAVITGFDKVLETRIIENGSVDWLINLENQWLKK